jgi:hypothetical protein
MSHSYPLIAIFTSRGEVGAYLKYPFLFSAQGEWIGWVSRERQVFSVHGHYVGWLNDDPRILRKLSTGLMVPRQMPPGVPERFVLPSQVPLAPLLPELLYGLIDVLDENPDLLPATDYGELREDLD